MPKPKTPTELQIKKFISEKKSEILNLIDKQHRVLLQANPASGKTHFFKNIANDIISGKRKGRLVFVAPFLIITKQFENNVNVDFALCGTSERKKLTKNDKIITSTFQSLHHIQGELNEDDILVIDEAHALFYNYDRINKQFYTSTVQALYHTKAKVVLMSGTPNLCLLQMLRLHHVKIVKSTEVKAKININFSKSSNADIVKAFAAKTMAKKKKSLNIVYIKSVKECNNICNMLIELGYNAKVLTSFEKDQETYKSISEIEKVSEDIQFIITTNVISTGANIQNTNIGSALMLNEFDASEIKQFSKRFRKKLNIEIDVVNKPSSSETNLLNSQNISKQRKYLFDSLEFYRNSQVNPSYNFDFKGPYHDENQELIDPKASIDRILDSYLRNESLVIDESVKSVENTKELLDSLNEYDDIEAKAITNFNKTVAPQIKKGDSYWDTKTKDLIEHFGDNTATYLYTMCSEYNPDWHSRNQSKILINGEFKKTTTSQTISDNINSANFLKEIYPPFLQYRSNFNTTADFIHYLKNKSSKTQNILPLALLLNELRNQYLIISKNNSHSKNNLSLELKDKPNFENLSSEIKALLILIKKTFEFSVLKDFIQIKDLKTYLEKDNCIKNAINEITSFNKIDQNLFKRNKNDFKIKNDNIVKALIESIFYAEFKRKGVEKFTSVVFKDSLPTGFSNEKIICTDQTVFIPNNKGEELILSFGVSPSKNLRIKYLNNYHLILSQK